MKGRLIVALLCAIAMGLSGVALRRYYVPYDLDDEIRIARAQGVATTVAACIKPVPSGENAAQDYDRAEALSDGLNTDDVRALRDSLTADAAPSSAQMQRLRAAYARNGAYIAAIHSAAAKPYWVVAATDDDPMNPFTRWARLREAAKAIRDEALMQMWEGRPVEAAKTLRLGLAIARHARIHPTLIGSMSGLSIDECTDNGYRRLLLHAGADPTVYSAIRVSLAPQIAPTDLRSALSGEIAATQAEIHNAESEWRREPFFKRAANEAEAAATCHWKTRVIVACQVVPERQRAAILSVINEHRDASNHNPVMKQGGDFLADLLGDLDQLDSQLASRRTLYSAACVLEYKARTGRYPLELSQAVRPVPLDPFSGVPLDYRRTARGFEVVSMEASRRWKAEHPSGHWNEMVFSYPK